MAYQISDRLIQISKPIIKDHYYHVRKDFYFNITDPKNSGIYNRAILTHVANDRLCQLALHKDAYYKRLRNPDEQNTERRIEYARSKTNYQLPPSPYTVVSASAKKFQATDRIRSLSAPKLRTENHLREEYSDRDRDPTNSGVYNKAVLKYEPTDRVRTLAEHKELVPSYQFGKPVIRTVSAAARNFQTTERLEELSKNFPHNIRSKFVRIA